MILFIFFLGFVFGSIVGSLMTIVLLIFRLKGDKK
jgi:hypothetical protein